MLKRLSGRATRRSKRWRVRWKSWGVEVEQGKAATTELEKRNRDAAADLQEMSEDLAKLREEHSRVKAALDESNKAVEAEGKTCASLRRKLHDQEQLLRTRQAELGEAQAYAGTIDTISAKDVVRAVDELNAEIFQLAAYVAEEFTFQDIPPSLVALEDAKNVVGLVLREMLLAVAKGCCNPHVVQLALQAASVQFAANIVRSWSVIPMQNAALQQAYEGVFAEGTPILEEATDLVLTITSETQAISAKWKLLTIRHTRHLRSTPEELKQRFVEIVTNVLEIAGARLKTVPDTMIESVRDRIREIIVLITRIQRHVGEDISSSDFRLIAPRGGDRFAEDVMEDANSCEGAPAQMDTAVLGATGLGLLRQQQTRRFGEKDGEIVVDVLLKASVMLDDLVDEFMEDPMLGESMD